MRILLVDDHVDTLELFSVLLDAWGHEVRAVQQPQLALPTALGFLPDAVFLDLTMDGMDGYEVAREFRENPRLGGVRLIAVTGRSREEVLAGGVRFDAHLMKPVEMQKLPELLQALSHERGE